MLDLGGIGFSWIAVLAFGFSSDDWLTQFGVIFAMRSFAEWSEGKGVLIASWHRFKGLEADAIVTFEAPFRDDAREWGAPMIKLEAVVVDEEKGFNELWWASLELVLRDPEDKGCF